MKRPILIILSVVVVFILLGTSVMYLFGSRVGFGGGASIEVPAPEYGFAPAATEAAATAPAFSESFDSVVIQDAVKLAAGQPQER